MKREVPQISITGFSGDYINEITGLYNVVKAYKNDGLNWFDLVRPLKKYKERYTDDDYMDVINDDNREKIEELDMFVDRVNKMLREKNRNTDEYLDLMRNIQILVHGSSDIR